MELQIKTGKGHNPNFVYPAIKCHQQIGAVKTPTTRGPRSVRGGKNRPRVASDEYWEERT
jgi:hypothetical protein